MKAYIPNPPSKENFEAERELGVVANGTKHWRVLLTCEKNVLLTVIRANIM